MCVHVNNVNMTSRMRREKYGRHENSNTSENSALQFTKRTALWSPDLLTDCGPPWVQRRKNSTLWTEKHCCPALRAIMTRRQIWRVSPESAHTHQREAHWPTAWSGWLPNVTKTRVRVYRHGTKGMWVDRMLDSLCDFELWPHPWPWIFRVNFWNSCISGMGGPINMEWKGYESIGCYCYYVTLSYDFDHGFWRSNFEKALP